MTTHKVALHPEGVDRNWVNTRVLLQVNRSPSTRRAWIEIICPKPNCSVISVALHPEGVDRNPRLLALPPAAPVALHPEGVDRNNMAKIDISKIDVALHSEGVDRNISIALIWAGEVASPPPKGRG